MKKKGITVICLRAPDPKNRRDVLDGGVDVEEDQTPTDENVTAAVITAGDCRIGFALEYLEGYVPTETRSKAKWARPRRNGGTERSYGSPHVDPDPFARYAGQKCSRCNGQYDEITDYFFPRLDEILTGRDDALFGANLQGTWWFRTVPTQGQAEKFRTAHEARSGKVSNDFDGVKIVKQNFADLLRNVLNIKRRPKLPDGRTDRNVPTTFSSADFGFRYPCDRQPSRQEYVIRAHRVRGPAIAAACVPACVVPRSRPINLWPARDRCPAELNAAGSEPIAKCWSRTALVEVVPSWQASSSIFLRILCVPIDKTELTKGNRLLINLERGSYKSANGVGERRFQGRLSQYFVSSGDTECTWDGLLDLIHPSLIAKNPLNQLDKTVLALVTCPDAIRPLFVSRRDACGSNG
ncbi:hypothetical protein EVAR_29480_1 [Eumeta japonica]|uniref:Uncharacterized protein n=1 Tax=Eumeta variegata TaxID=151549 RepID=A0A4C1WWG4_EUMVA|nr:hypothetical protein EVAR_29480_1 [Eumeta japonica]